MYTQQDKQGFVILIAVLVSTLVISIGAFIASIAIKELALSSSGSDSQVAFYAADSALECALYQDLREFSFAATSSSPGPTTVYCNGTDVAIDLQTGDANESQTYFDVSFIITGRTEDESPYARIKVDKENIGTINDKTIIEAQGYNVKDPDAVNRVERALQVIY